MLLQFDAVDWAVSGLSSQQFMGTTVFTGGLSTASKRNMVNFCRPSHCDFIFGNLVQVLHISCFFIFLSFILVITLLSEKTGIQLYLLEFPRSSNDYPSERGYLGIASVGWAQRKENMLVRLLEPRNRSNTWDLFFSFTHFWLSSLVMQTNRSQWR